MLAFGIKGNTMKEPLIECNYFIITKSYLSMSLTLTFQGLVPCVMVWGMGCAWPHIHVLPPPSPPSGCSFFSILVFFFSPLRRWCLWSPEPTAWWPYLAPPLRPPLPKGLDWPHRCLASLLSVGLGKGAVVCVCTLDFPLSSILILYSTLPPLFLCFSLTLLPLA